ncbi:class C sortase [Enemella sp. A6]|uniref:class C sortase n=1 Tax=Enemella sp. A6 TaxID=3440152 RepID=UPI003EB96B84
MTVTARREIQAPSRRKRWPFFLIFIVGLAILAYPLLTRIFYDTGAAQSTQEFEDARAALSPEEVERRLALARGYNEALETGNLSDPYTEEQKEGVAEYARMLELHERLGHVSVPKLALDLPMYAGTSESVLQKGVGHLEGTSLPVGGNSTHTVLTAHRGLPSARLFSELDRLDIGDKFYIHNVGGVMAYQIDQIKVVEPENFNDLLVEPGHDYATLLTCTPYMINSHRLLVRGHRVEYVAAVEERNIAEQRRGYFYRLAFFAATGLFLITLLVALRGYFRRRKLTRRIASLEAARAED